MADAVDAPTIAPAAVPEPPAPDAVPVPTAPEAEADVKEVLKNADHDDTTVTEEVQPAVTHEVVEQKELDVGHPTLEREIHEDTYHTTVHPVTDTQVVPEQIVHTIAPVTEQTTDERDPQGVQDHLAQEAAQFHNERVVHDVVHTAAQAPTVVAEHHHYHVHERIQPVIQRQVVQPTVVHTTVPVHQVIHKSAHFSEPTSLTPVSLTDFQQHGGHLQGREPHETTYTGKPHETEAASYLYDSS